MNDFLNTLFHLSMIDPMPINFTLAVVLVGALGFIGPAIVDIIYSFKREKPMITDEEKNLADQFNILFRMRMELRNRGQSVEFETQQLSDIADRLEIIRANKTSR